jgi:hypothetical protein
MKVETDSITSISALGQALILVIIYCETFKTDVTVFIGNIIMGLTSHILIIFSNRVSLLILRSLGKMSKLPINAIYYH